MKTINYFVLGVFLTGLGSELAYGRRNDREGFNFGTSVRIMDNDDRGQSTDSENNATRTKSSGQAFSPYLGYGFGPINLGLKFVLENKAEEFTETNSSTNQTINRQAVMDSKSASLFTRFNFGKIMFLEAGGGLYTDAKTVHTEIRSSNGGSFSGTASDYKQNGAGPGYHVGGGIELPADNGFYFTGSYIVHSYRLHDASKSSYGGIIGVQQKRELSFGISYYN